MYSFIFVLKELEREIKRVNENLNASAITEEVSAFASQARAESNHRYALNYMMFIL